MTFEIRGAGCINKGAYLMLLATIEQIKKYYPNARIAVKPRHSLNYNAYSKLGLYPKFDYRRFGIEWGFLIKILPKKFRNSFGILTEQDIDVILDISGFVLGDQWGKKTAKEIYSNVSRWHKKDKIVIFLPQAFGPFTVPGIDKAVRGIVKNANLIFPREVLSNNFLVDAIGASFNSKIKISPDFTCLIDPELTSINNKFSSQKVCIIPNQKMVTRGSKDQGKRYLYFLSWIAAYLREKGLTPYFLIHEGSVDKDLAEKACKAIFPSVMILQPDDPVEIKRIISSSYAIISSRYHGAVSALSQSIPVLVTSWSHKYEMLFDDYGIQDGILKLTDNESEWCLQLNRILDSSKNIEMREQLRLKTLEQKQMAIDMWAIVFDYIAKKEIKK